MGEAGLLDLIWQKSQVRPSRARLVRNFAYVDVTGSEQAEMVMKSFTGEIKAYISKPPEQDTSNVRTAFLQNLPPNISENQIRSVFEPCGTISDVRIKKSALNKVFAYVEFSHESSLAAALALDGGNLFGEDHKVSIEKSIDKDVLRKKQETERGKNTIHITNLSYKTTDKDISRMLKDHFGVEEDHILKIIIIYDKNTSRSKGYGYIEFK